VSVLIVGGGFSGLLLAKLIGDGVLVFEEDGHVGLPEHCAGIVSPKTLKLIGAPKSLVEAEFDELRICFGSSFLSFRGDPIVVKIDRVMLEEYLYSEALSSGAEIRLGARVSGVDVDGRVLVGSEVFRGNVVVLAEGAKRCFSRALGLIDECDAYHGIQVRLRASSSINRIEVYVMEMLGDFFSWLVPIVESRQVIVGLASRSARNLRYKLNALVSLLERQGKLRVHGEIKWFGGTILTGPVGRVVNGRVVGIGDDVQMNKPLTGGGLYPSAIAARILAEEVNSALNGDFNFGEAIANYTVKVKPLIKLLRTAYAATKILRFSNYFIPKTIAMGASKLNLSSKLLAEIDYDEHYNSLLKSIISNPFRLAEFTASMLIGMASYLAS